MNWWRCAKRYKKQSCSRILDKRQSPIWLKFSATCSRLLKTWLLEPRRDRSDARQRLAATAALRGAGSGQGPWQLLRSELRGVSDVERITARIALRQVRPPPWCATAA